LYACVIDTNNRVVVHTGGKISGTPAPKHNGQKDTWGEIESLRFKNSNDIRVCEYRSPLTSGSKDFGSIRLAVADPSIWTNLSNTTENFLMALILPLLILWIGTVILRRLTTPLATVESQIQNVASAQIIKPETVNVVAGDGLYTEGWNKIVAFIQRGGNSANSQIQNAVNHYRNNQVFEILDSLPDGIAVTDSELKIKISNQSFSALFNLQTDNRSPDGRNLTEFLNANRIENSHNDQTDEADDWNLPAAVTEIKRQHGESERVLRVARYFLQQNNAKTGQMVWAIRDITQQKLTERMRDEFLDSATHELRTPLSNIKAYSETLAISEVLNIEQQKEFCNTINSEATRLARLIDDLLSISNVEAGSMAISRENVEVDRMMREIISTIKPSMSKKNIEFNVTMPQKTLPSLFIDKDKIQVAMVNILGNAAKYTPAGGRVDVFVRLTDEQIEFSVEDTGIGVRKEDIPKLFEKFFRCADNDVQNETGTGLGLSLADEVVRLHGGKITIESEYGKGSQFTIVLPARQGALV
jgi:signal transduction histidine kinase